MRMVTAIVYTVNYGTVVPLLCGHLWVIENVGAFYPGNIDKRLNVSV